MGNKTCFSKESKTLCIIIRYFPYLLGCCMVTDIQSRFYGNKQTGSGNILTVFISQKRLLASTLDTSKSVQGPSYILQLGSYTIRIKFHGPKPLGGHA